MKYNLVEAAILSYHLVTLLLLLRRSSSFSLLRLCGIRCNRGKGFLLRFQYRTLLSQMSKQRFTNYTLFTLRKVTYQDILNLHQTDLEQVLELVVSWKVSFPQL